MDDYNELAALWSAPPRKEEQRELEQLAQRTVRRARLVQWGELIVVIGLAGLVTGAMLLHLAPTTILMGSLLLLLLGWSAWKRHHLGNIALLIDQRDRLSFVTSSLRAKQAEVNRSALGLALILPGALMMVLLWYSLRAPAGGGDVFAFLWSVWSTPRGLAALGFLACAILVLSLSHARLVKELGGLKALRDEYAEEDRQDRLDEI